MFLPQRINCSGKAIAYVEKICRHIVPICEFPCNEIFSCHCWGTRCPFNLHPKACEAVSGTEKVLKTLQLVLNVVSYTDFFFSEACGLQH